MAVTVFLLIMSLCGAIVLLLACYKARRTADADFQFRLLLISGVATFTGAVVFAISLLSAWVLIENKTFDYLSTTSVPDLTAESPVIVAIDEPSMAEINMRWPWPRSLHAQMIERLRSAGAKVVALDVIFSEPSSPIGDGALEASLGRDVVLAADQSLLKTQHAVQEIKTMPLQLFLNKGALPGVASIELSSDGVFRKLPLYRDAFAKQIASAAGVPSIEPTAGDMAQVYGGARSFKTVSYYQALDPQNFLPPNFFQDRVVIVGLALQHSPTLSSGGADAFATPYTVHSGHLTAGAEIQATIFENIRRGDFIKPASGALQIVFSFTACVMAVVLVRSKTNVFTILAGLVGMTVIFAASFAILQVSRSFASPLQPALAFALILVGSASIDYARERKMRKQVTRAFSQYLSPDLVSQLAKNPGMLKLGGEKKTITILFCDVRGFTTIAEGMKNDPTALTTLINRLLTPLSNVVLDNRGTIDKYIGDCLMAFWNAPLPDEKHAIHAVTASLAMLEAMVLLNQSLKTEALEKKTPFHPLRIGIGINTGVCVVGNMGSDKRFDYSALGDAVNLASRLEGTSKNYGLALLIGETTARLVENHFCVLELDRVQVKGRSESSPVFTVLKTIKPSHRTLHDEFLRAKYAGQHDLTEHLARQLSEAIPDLSPYYLLESQLKNAL